MKSHFKNFIYKGLFGMEDDGEGAGEALFMATAGAVFMIFIILAIIKFL